MMIFTLLIVKSDCVLRTTSQCGYHGVQRFIDLMLAFQTSLI